MVQSRAAESKTHEQRKAGEETLPDMLGAVDLGSNSFHMIVASPDADGLKIVDRLREPVRLGAGLRPDGSLSEEAQRRALVCLRRFGQRLRKLPSQAVRAVGTNTLRAAHNAGAFLNAAEEALGHPIEVIAGVEEARLIYLGVAHSLAPSGERRLVVDIGGGSTELIIGEQFRALHVDSLQMGSVSFTGRFFADGKFSRKRWEAAELAARLELAPVAVAYTALHWQNAIGASGTIRSVSQVLNALGWEHGGIAAASITKLRELVLKAGQVANLKLPGLAADRAPIFAAGVAVLGAVFDVLGIQRMEIAGGALRDGLLYDLLGRLHDDDIRTRSVGALAARFRTDRAQAARVEETALACLAAVAGPWELADEACERLLSWAAQLHEIGLDIAHSQYHKHGAYVAEHADLAGFSREEQHLLAVLIRAQRRKFPLALFSGLPPRWAERLARLAILLRLAVLLHRARSHEPLPRLTLRAGPGLLQLRFPRGWLRAHALTRADLEQEAVYLSAAGLRLEYVG